MKLANAFSSVARALLGSASPHAVSGTEARRLVTEDHAILLDVRTPQEFRAGHLDGALNIPVQALGGRLEELDRGRPIVAYCRSGGRSASATQMLRREGFTAHDLGPMGAWG
ncbi:MAG: rhodanese-like domain-containing protein [Sandaracinaceae bacterium]